MVHEEKDVYFAVKFEDCVVEEKMEENYSDNDDNDFDNDLSEDPIQPDRSNSPYLIYDSDNDSFSEFSEDQN